MQAISRQPQRTPDSALHDKSHLPEQAELYRLVRQCAVSCSSQTIRLAQVPAAPGTLDSRLAQQPIGT